MFNELITDLHLLGYNIEPFGNNDFVIQGTPADVDQGNEKQVIESMLEQYKHFSNDLKFSKRERLVRSLACQHAIKSGKRLAQREMHLLVQELFQCDTPNATVAGSPTYLEYKKDYLDKMFGGDTLLRTPHPAQKLLHFPSYGSGAALVVIYQERKDQEFVAAGDQITT